MTKFVNDKLVTSRRFAPGSGRVPEGENVKGRTLVSGIVPADQDDGTLAEAEKEKLEKLVRREEANTKAAVLEREIAETRKQRLEVLEMLRQAADNLEREAQLCHEQSAFFAALDKNLQSLPEQFSEGELRTVKQAVRTGQIELAKFFQSQPLLTAGHGSDASISAASGLGFWPLARLGVGLTWPLMLVVLATGALLAFVLYALFA